MLVRCATCSKQFDVIIGAFNRARKRGMALYCNRTCAGIARRTNKTAEQKKAEKHAYDQQYRSDNLERILAGKREYHARTYTYEGGVAYRALKKAQGWDHTEYCRRAEQVAKRKSRDRNRYAAEFGPYAECHTLLMDLLKEINGRITDYETRQQNGTLNKGIARRRAYEAATGGNQDTHGGIAQGRAVGNAQRREK